jgi:hypothetical protein
VRYHSIHHHGSFLLSQLDDVCDKECRFYLICDDAPLKG